MSRRAVLRGARRAVPEAERRRAAGRVADHVRRSELVGAGDLVGLHVSGDGELDMGELARTLAALGAVTALPVVQRAGAMTFRTWRPGDAVTTGRYGIPVPVRGTTVPPCALDVAFVPCVAIDAAGRRLGRGGGYYDRAFETRRRDAPPPLLVGVGYDLQIVDAVTVADHDVDLDVVVTPSRLWWTLPSGRHRRRMVPRPAARQD